MKHSANWFHFHPRALQIHLLPYKAGVSVCGQHRVNPKTVPANFPQNHKFAKHSRCSLCEKRLAEYFIDPALWFVKTAELFAYHRVSLTLTKVDVLSYIIPWQDLHLVLQRQAIYDKFKHEYGFRRLVHFDGLDADLTEQILTKLGF